MVRIDGTLRRNADVGIDDRVSIRKVNAKEATKVTVAPTRPLRIIGGEEYLLQMLEGRVLVKGDIVEVNTLEGRIDLVVTNASPVADALLVKRTTEFIVSEKPAGEVPTIPRISYEDIGGAADEVKRVREMIELPLRHPELFERLGVEAPKGVLLHGPPGTGKTLLAKAVATESEANFISVKGPEFLSKWVGESEKAVRETFRKARQAAPCVIFFDEIDSIAPSRGGGEGDSHVTERVISQMLTEMDGLEGLEDVVVVAATNRLDIVDPALLMPGRFDRVVRIPSPDLEARKQIPQIHASNKPLAKGVDIDELTRMTEGFTGADLAAVANEAAMSTIRAAVEKNKDITDEDIDKAKIAMKSFLEAVEKLNPKARSTSGM